jgi:hypothetical protein
MNQVSQCSQLLRWTFEHLLIMERMLLAPFPAFPPGQPPRLLYCPAAQSSLVGWIFDYPHTGDSIKLMPFLTFFVSGDTESLWEDVAGDVMRVVGSPRPQAGCRGKRE